MGRLALVLIFWGVWLAGCASDAKVRQAITTHDKERAILRPYVSEDLFYEETDLVMNAFIDILRSKGAQILFWDKTHGVLSWYDLNSQFAPLPFLGDSVNIPGMYHKRIITWRGYVFATARFVSSGNQTWARIYSAGRDSDSGRRIYSDGTYEGWVLKSVNKILGQDLSTSRTSTPAPTYMASSSKIVPRNYDELFQRRFEGLSHISISGVLEKGSKTEYPVPAERLWKAILDVATQYAVVPSLNSRERSLVFSRRVTVPLEGMKSTGHLAWSFSTQTPLNPQVIKDAITGKNSIDSPAQKVTVLTPMDVVMAIVVKSVSGDSSVLYTALLGKENLSPTPYMSKNTTRTKDDAVSEVLASPLKTGASIVESELINQVDFQLFYNENLGTKLLRSLQK